MKKKSSKEVKAATPLPMRKILVLGTILAANNCSIWMIFSFLPFMVKLYYPELSVKELGYRAGILGSAFSTGSLFGNFMWGLISDRYGRRIALLAGLLGTSVAAFLFGFSPNFVMAVISRFLWGFLNGNIGVSKTYMSEITDDTNNARGMALFAVVGGVGRTIGPMLGGFLSEPARLYPNVFKDTIFETFPYALPNFIIAINCLIVGTVAYFELPETLRLKRNRVQFKSFDNDNKEGYHKVMSSDDEEMNSLKEEGNYNNEKKTIDNNEVSNHGHDVLLGMRKRDSSNEVEEGIELSTINDSPAGKRRVSFSSLVMVRVIGSNSLAYGQLKRIKPDEFPSELQDDENDDSYGSDDEKLDDEYKSLTSNHDGGDGDLKRSEAQFNQIGHKLRFTNGSEYNDSMEMYLQSTWTQIKYLMSKREIFFSCLLYGTTAFVQITTTEIFPLWVVTSKTDGGFGFDTSKIGLLTSITGPITIVLQLVLYPYLTEKYGVFYVYRLGCLMTAIAMILVPCISIFNNFNVPWLVWVSTVCALTAISAFATFSLISVFVFINNSCYSHERGTVNGIGQTFAAFGRLLGPYFGSVSFAWSEINGYSWPLNYFFVWYIMGALSILNYGISRFLPRTLQRRKREPIEPRYALYQKDSG